MTEPNAADRRAPKRARVQVADLTLIVRPNGRPDKIAAFTDSEADEANDYAARMGAHVERLATDDK
ncbi:hypothetical protein GCM10027169_32640 [Gordonia jinhuaensis]|uniref:Uncharacterized protein n=1 Tax=Gordonia jinhuaensis TaxID=1517702 RepID=A0A916T681_9ACTN|nr:hypothetical protein [Gordonia jinhuaensis]GGB33265.1 hypothetical protein GCM10011489_21780 [Gordonia jinhuaensis]